MKYQLTPIERHKKNMKVTTWILSILTILLVSIIVIVVSYI